MYVITLFLRYRALATRDEKSLYKNERNGLTSRKYVFHLNLEIFYVLCFCY